MPRNTKKTKTNPSRFYPLILILVGTSLLAVSLFHWYLRLKSLTPNVAIIEQVSTQDRDLPVHIEIPWKVDVDIVASTLEGDRWSISENKASFLIQSAFPGEGGNIIIYGHNKRSILGNIRAMKVDEIISLTTQSGRQFKYQVETIHEVSPSQTQYLDPSNEEVLTLYTCSGLLDSQRFIVVAKPLN